MALRDRLREARHGRFVGREGERALFAEALAAETLPFHVLMLHGPGGVGKTTLLREFQALAEEANVSATYLDARDLEPAPEAFRQALGRAEPGPATEGRAVLLVDTYETIAELDGWMREEFLPEVSEHLLVVLAGRYPPSPGWRSDLGWRDLTRVVALRNLTPAESQSLLGAQGIPAQQHEAILSFTHGHPLALSLVADYVRRKPDVDFVPEASPDVVGTLLKRFIQETDEDLQNATLETASVVRAVTEELLDTLLSSATGAGHESTREAFEWLRGLSFVEAGPNGLFLHDLVRDVLAADLRWRQPERFADLSARARSYYTRKLLAADAERDQQHVLADYAFLHRHNAVVRPLLGQLRSQWREAQPQAAGVPDADEQAQLRTLVAQHEGEAAAEIAAHWLGLQPENVQLFRDADGSVAGFLFHLDLDRTTAEQRAADPAAEAAWAYLEEHAPLRPGERATVFRFWLDREAYQGVSAVQSLIFVATVRYYLRTPGLAFTFLPCADPDLWGLVLMYAGLRRLPEADFTVGDRTFGVFGHDWRAVPPERWLGGLAERGLPATPDAMPQPERLIVLSRPDFEAAVQDVLRDFARPHELESSPLLRSRLVAGHGERRVEALCALINEVAEELQATPREEPYYLALDATYLDPARTQAEAAEQLDMPFSSYRRYLKRGIEHVVEGLWQREIGGHPHVG